MLKTNLDKSIAAILVIILLFAAFMISRDISTASRIKETCQKTNIYDSLGSPMYDCSGVGMGDLQ